MTNHEFICNDCEQVITGEIYLLTGTIDLFCESCKDTYSDPHGDLFQAIRWDAVDPLYIFHTHVERVGVVPPWPQGYLCGCQLCERAIGAKEQAEYVKTGKRS